MMMGRALLVVGALATLGLIATGVVGYVSTLDDINLHIMLALGSSLLLLFSHCWIMFYLIGTGKAVRETVAEHGLDTSILEETKRYKMESNPWMMMAMMLVMATFILGGGVATRVIPGWVHHGLFWLSVVVQIKTLWIENRVLAENEILMSAINDKVAAEPASV